MWLLGVFCLFVFAQVYPFSSDSDFIPKDSQKLHDLWYSIFNLLSNATRRLVKQVILS